MSVVELESPADGFALFEARHRIRRPRQFRAPGVLAGARCIYWVPAASAALPWRLRLGAWRGESAGRAYPAPRPGPARRLPRRLGARGAADLGRAQAEAARAQPPVRRSPSGEPPPDRGPRAAGIRSPAGRAVARHARRSGGRRRAAFAFFIVYSWRLVAVSPARLASAPDAAMASGGSGWPDACANAPKLTREATTAADCSASNATSWGLHKSRRSRRTTQGRWP